MKRFEFNNEIEDDVSSSDKKNTFLKKPSILDRAKSHLKGDNKWKENSVKRDTTNGSQKNFKSTSSVESDSDEELKQFLSKLGNREQNSSNVNSASSSPIKQQNSYLKTPSSSPVKKEVSPAKAASPYLKKTIDLTEGKSTENKIVNISPSLLQPKKSFTIIPKHDEDLNSSTASSRKKKTSAHLKNNKRFFTESKEDVDLSEESSDSSLGSDFEAFIKSKGVVDFNEKLVEKSTEYQLNDEIEKNVNTLKKSDAIHNIGEKKVELLINHETVSSAPKGKSKVDDTTIFNTQMEVCSNSDSEDEAIITKPALKKNNGFDLKNETKVKLLQNKILTISDLFPDSEEHTSNETLPKTAMQETPKKILFEAKQDSISENVLIEEKKQEAKGSPMKIDPDIDLKTNQREQPYNRVNQYSPIPDMHGTAQSCNVQPNFQLNPQPNFQPNFQQNFQPHLQCNNPSYNQPSTPNIQLNTPYSYPLAHTEQYSFKYPEVPQQLNYNDNYGQKAFNVPNQPQFFNPFQSPASNFLSQFQPPYLNLPQFPVPQQAWMQQSFKSPSESKKIETKSKKERNSRESEYECSDFEVDEISEILDFSSSNSNDLRNNSRDNERQGSSTIGSDFAPSISSGLKNVDNTILDSINPLSSVHNQQYLNTNIPLNDTLHKLTTIQNPNQLILNELFLGQIKLIEQFVEICKRLAVSESRNSRSNYKYIKLEDVQKYIRENKKATLTMDEALEQIRLDG
ncbi:hypothetical protein HK099_007904 [Clydaea vesicula]|uniref:DUF4614 domain-containing protein n=1 Tax=Clydaea vesicula TaxID=447962 RepID=A0AAD5U575_9FUNG|nr:hypothetical protein HK099_007904 [Clydaea vesicula]